MSIIEFGGAVVLPLTAVVIIVFLVDPHMQHNRSIPTIAAMDIGTRYSRVAVVKADGSMWTSEKIASVVSFTNSGDVLIGESGPEPQNTFSHLNLILGRRYGEIPDLVKELPYLIVQDSGRVYLKVHDRRHPPEVFMALLMLKLKDMGEEQLQGPIDSVVLSIPADFKRQQRQAFINAARIARLSVAKFTPASTCVALSEDLQPGVTAVVSIGAGFMGVSLIRVETSFFSGTKTFDTMSEDGIPKGGDDVTREIFKAFSKEAFRIFENVDRRGPFTSQERLALRHEAEDVKVRLGLETMVDADILGYSVPVEQESMVMYSEVIKNTISTLLIKALKRAKLDIEAIDRMLLDGGSVKLPRLQQFLQDLLAKGKEAIKATSEASVASGAAMQAHKITSRGTFSSLSNFRITERARRRVDLNLKNGATVAHVKRGEKLPITFTPKVLEHHQGRFKVEYFLRERHKDKFQDQISSMFTCSGQNWGSLYRNGLVLIMTVHADSSIDVTCKIGTTSQANTLHVSPLASNWKKKSQVTLAKTVIELMERYRKTKKGKPQKDEL